MKDLYHFLPRFIDMLHEVCTVRAGLRYGKKHRTATGSGVLKSMSI